VNSCVAAIRLRKEGRAIKQRILTAAIALPLLILFIIYAGTVLFNLLIVAVAALSLHEFYAMVLPVERRPESYLATLLGALFAALLCWQAGDAVLLALAGAFLLLALVFLFRHQDISVVVGQLGCVMLGWLYVALPLSYIARLHALDSGRAWVFFVLVIVMIGDSAALFSGRALGKHKLYPSVSPNKTIEGSLGGLVGSLVGAVVFTRLLMPELGFGFVLGATLLIGVVSQLGDLFESLLKRGCNVKDSGTIIPGHGGMLDRLDSLLFAFPVAYYLALWIG